MDAFSDIMELPHHTSGKRRKMTLQERAAQFAAFAALTGFDEEISAASVSECSADAAACDRDAAR